MTTTYNAPSYSNVSPVAALGLASDEWAFHDTVTTTAALAINDGGTFGYLPANAVVVGFWAKFSALDTGSPTLTLDIGVTGSAQKFLAADTTGRAGGMQQTMATTGYGYKTTSKIAITWLAHAAASAGGAAGTIELYLRYRIEN